MNDATRDLITQAIDAIDHVRWALGNLRGPLAELRETPFPQTVDEYIDGAKETVYVGEAARDFIQRAWPWWFPGRSSHLPDRHPGAH